MGSDGSIPLCIAFVLLVLTGAYFAGAESSFSAVSKIRIKAKAEEGNKRAKRVLYILNHFEKALTTLLVGNNITHIAAASVAAVIATRLFKERTDVDSFGFSMLVTLASTAIIFLFSEMIPKALANDRSETTSLISAGSLRFLMKVLTPVSAFFGLIIKGASRLFAKEETPSITEDELIDIIDTVEEEGVVDEEQSDMLKSALEFGDTTAGDIMTMARDVEAINAASSNKEIVQAICQNIHSRLPVYAEKPEHIIGTLRARRFLTEYQRNPAVKVRSVLSAPYYVKEEAKIADLLEDMRQHKHHMAIVLDEHKKAVGILTIEDILEELVGEIFDEEDKVDRNFQALGGNKYLVNTHLLVGALYERMGLSSAPRAVAAKPLLSLALEKLGHLPEEEESFLFGNLEITVDTVKDGCPEEMLVHILDEEELAERRVVREVKQ